MIKLLS